MIPTSRTLLKIPSPERGEKRTGRFEADTTEGLAKRQCTEAHHVGVLDTPLQDDTPASTQLTVAPANQGYHNLLNELLQRVAQWLLTPVDDVGCAIATGTVRQNLLRLAALSMVNRHWRTAMVPTLHNTHTQYTRSLVADWHGQSSDAIDSDNEDPVVLPMPSVFTGMDIQHLASGVRNLLKSLLHVDGSRFVSLMVLRALLPAAAELVST